MTGLVVASRLPLVGCLAGALIGHPAAPWMTGLVVASRLPLVGCLAGALIGHPAVPWMTGLVGIASRLPLAGCHLVFSVLSGKHILVLVVFVLTLASKLANVAHSLSSPSVAWLVLCYTAIGW